MKKLTSILALLALASSVLAQRMEIADVEAVPGETVCFTMNLHEGKADTYTSLQFTAWFPTSGFATTGSSSLSSQWPNASATVGDIYPDGSLIVAVSSSDEMTGTDIDDLIKVYFTVGESVAVGEYPVRVEKITLGYGFTDKDVTDEVTFTVHVVAMHTVTLDENSTTAPEASDGAVNVRVKRTIKADQWSTICLPFGMTAAQTKAAFGDDVQLEDFKGYETEEDDGGDIVGITVNFSELASPAIEANHPYIIKVSEAVTEFTADAVEIDPEEEPTVAAVKRTKKQWSEMIGTYAAGTVLEATTLFLNSNKFYYSAGATKMKGFRTYFDFYDVLTEVEEAYSEVKMAFNVDGIETRVDGIGGTQLDAIYYDLSGRRTQKPAQRGIYIVNGRKTVVK